MRVTAGVLRWTTGGRTLNESGGGGGGAHRGYTVVLYACTARDREGRPPLLAGSILI